MLNAKLCRGYWSEGQVLRIRELFSATLWTHFTWWNECGCFFCRVPCLNKNKKGGHTGRPISNDEGTLALLLVFGRFVCWRCRRRLCRRRRCLRSARHAVLEAPDAFAKSLHDFRDPLTSEENQDNSQNHKPMKNTKFTHEPPPRVP